MFVFFSAALRYIFFFGGIYNLLFKNRRKKMTPKRQTKDAKHPPSTNVFPKCPNNVGSQALRIVTEKEIPKKP